MKSFFIAFFLFIPATLCLSQSINWEVANVGLTFGNANDKNGNTVRDQPGLSLGTAIHLNILKSRLSPGIEFTYSGWNRHTPSGVNAFHQKSFILQGILDYNFISKNRWIRPFMGIGVGVSRIKATAKSDGYADSKTTHPAISPRVGMELFNKIRLTAEYKYQGKYNSFFDLKLGFVVKM